MARLNITLPDVLYARLEQLRDRINLSKVCATALEKEVMMLEGQPNITDPRIAQLLQRLQSTRERWHQRGYEDGDLKKCDRDRKDPDVSVVGVDVLFVFFGVGLDFIFFRIYRSALTASTLRNQDLNPMYKPASNYK